MTRRSWLISWIGKTDHDAASARPAGDEVGPVASALLGGPRHDRVYLLTNYDFEVSRRYCDWVAQKTGYPPDAIDLYQIDLASPIDYASIYVEVSKNLKQAGLPRDDVDLTFHLSPGTSAMTAIWIILAKTRFPAKLIQTSREHGLQQADGPSSGPSALQRLGHQLATEPPPRQRIVTDLHRRQQPGCRRRAGGCGAWWEGWIAAWVGMTERVRSVGWGAIGRLPGFPPSRE
jgi:hypothetical protein